MIYSIGTDTIEIIGVLLDYSTPLVRERSTVQSCPAAPIFQRLNNGFGRDKHPECTAETPVAPLETCKIRGAPATEAAILRGSTKLALVTLQTAQRCLTNSAKQHLVDDAIEALRIGLEMAREEAGNV